VNHLLDNLKIKLLGSRECIRAFPEAERYATGCQLLRVQQGLDPQDWKPMKAIGAGGAFRVFYVTSIGNALYVLYAFQADRRAK